MYEKLATAAEFIQSQAKQTPKVGIVLGSGLGPFIDSLTDQQIIPYSEIPFFQQTTVEGHEGRVILGNVGDVPVAILHGRLHAYEGLPMEEIVFPVRTLATLGIEHLLLTNAAGGVNPDFTPGDLVIINDHINLIGQNPLVGRSIKDFGTSFPDMGQAYPDFIKKAFKESAKEINISLKEGVYAAMLGPTYETVAEVKMLNVLGADMVGMSTVPESIAANHLGLNVGGISCITNMANGIGPRELEQENIRQRAQEVMQNFSRLLCETIKKLA
jgi:purine-nucleoside phosphorylase